MSLLPGIKTDLPWDLVKKLYVEDRLSTSRIAETFKCSPTTISKGLKIMDVHVHNRNFDCAKSINNESLIHLYVDEEMTPQELGVICKVSPKTILRRLHQLGVKIRSDKSTEKFSDEELIDLYNECPRSCNELGEILGVQSRTVERRLSLLGVDPEKCPKKDDAKSDLAKRKRYKNMVKSIKWDVSLEWLSSFDDIDKIMFLNEKSRQKNRGYEVKSTEQYIEFIEHFYDDKQFNLHYTRWKQTGAREDKPSLDHVLPRSMGGTDNIENLTFVSWFENRAKNDLDLIGYLDSVETYYGIEARRKVEERYGIR